ncbi:MAG: hypothetical protein A2X49_09980 [Lentisphaerae bacterium GWF2_52_8]|nr:MAG: hypothetical protein A2X49_09980 [Lentisphaerae bacterium GWF2_52_8]
MKKMKLLCLAAAVLLGHGILIAEPKLPRIFGENMVLQRDIELPVWGWADPGEEVSVDFAGQSKKAEADKNGEWKLKLDKMPASAEGREFKVSSSKQGNPLVLKNVLVGDVWFCSGQSNMEWCVGACNSPDDVKSADFPNIRNIKVSHVSSEMPEKDISASGWRICSPQTVSGFTAAGFFFAREIQKETGIPIGLIDDNWGGTTIEPWCSRESLGSIPELEVIYKAYETKLANYRKLVSEKLPDVEQWVEKVKKALAENKELPKLPLAPNPCSSGPCAIFNAMVAPVIPYGIKGALWYQGESNGGDGDIYFHKMRALIGGWRKLWQEGDFPFYFVQLANYTEGGDGYAKIRCAQTKALSIPNTGMAVIIDIGEANNIHPKNKQDVGKRLALWSLAKDYGKKDLVFSGPLFKEMKIEGNKIRLSFDNLGSGLMIGKKTGLTPTAEDKEAKLKRFAIAGEDKKWVWADALIENDSVVVSSPEVSSPVAVRYAFSANPEGANLYNREGLPASPFRTDNW